MAGANAVALDAAAAAVKGFDPAGWPYLGLAERRGLGLCDPDAIWVRGVEIGDARQPFGKAE